MLNTEDIIAQQKLLQTHRQTLHILLTQQAQFGIAYTPPAIIHGIRTARAAIAAIKTNLSQSGVQEADLPDDAEPDQGSASMVTTPSQAAPTAGGDVIMATIGAGAQGVAVGKNIQQTIGAPTSSADDQQLIEALLGQLQQSISSSPIDSSIQTMASFQLRLLTGELSKISGSVPSANTITQVVDGLLTSLPTLKPYLQQLFTSPAVIRRIQRADQPLDDWVQQRFNG